MLLGIVRGGVEEEHGRRPRGAIGSSRSGDRHQLEDPLVRSVSSAFERSTDTGMGTVREVEAFFSSDYEPRLLSVVVVTVLHCTTVLYSISEIQYNIYIM